METGKKKIQYVFICLEELEVLVDGYWLCPIYR